jgi:hypothetical protein
MLSNRWLLWACQIVALAISLLFLSRLQFTNLLLCPLHFWVITSLNTSIAMLQHGKLLPMPDPTHTSS